MPDPQDRPWTKGEWRIEDNRDLNGAFWIGVDLPDVGFVSHAEVRAGCDEARAIGDPEANAHLFAAAKELYEAAAEALQFIEANGLAHGRKLAAALSKALGERP